MKPALVVIDVQNEYFAPHGKWVLPDGESALVAINALVDAARASEIPVFRVQHQDAPSAGEVFVAGSVGAETYPGLHASEQDIVITKHFPGSFTDTPLGARLQQEGIDTVVICGYMTQLCCDTTTRQAAERDYQVLFAADGTAARALKRNGAIISHQQIQDTTLAVMTQFALVLPAEEIISRLQTHS